ncbi:minor tail protein [Gordonia phage EMoore]|uniref:DUF7572 domain-containing protein n=1 Tax=Gordonia phage EMoore TaxID=2656534 RepID=A0A649VTB2_9CAUD|nr:minor tail protein [Gordonia phage EMoore]QGJ95820.1 hypothetical protein SEA_EMOORE_34 [Gordonia phage EMoore]
MNVEYVGEATWMMPTTNLYRCDDGRYLLVMVLDLPSAAALSMSSGLRVPVSRAHLRAEVSVFWSDERGSPVDADGDPLNGMTPWASTDPETQAPVNLHPDGDHPIAAYSHEGALAALGYTLTPPAPERIEP